MVVALHAPMMASRTHSRKERTMHNANDTRPVWSDRQRAFIAAYKWLYNVSGAVAYRAYEQVTESARALCIAQYSMRSVARREM